MTYQQIFKNEKLLPLHTNCYLQQLLLYLRSTLEVWKGIVPILYFIYSNMIYIIYFEWWKVREWFQKYKYTELDFLFCLLLRLENMKEVCGEHFKHSDACLPQYILLSHTSVIWKAGSSYIIINIQSSSPPPSNPIPTSQQKPTNPHADHADPFMLPAAVRSLNYATTPVECCSDVWTNFLHCTTFELLERVPVFRLNPVCTCAYVVWACARMCACSYACSIT